MNRIATVCTLPASLRHVHYHLTMSVLWDCMKSVCPIAIICVDLRQWHLSTTDIFDASVRILGTSILCSFSSVSTFPRALGLFWPGLPHRMAVIAIYPTNYATLRPGELRLYILRKGCASRNAFIRKEKFWARISREVKTLKALKVIPKYVYGPSLEYGNDWAIFFFHWYVKNRLQNSNRL